MTAKTKAKVTAGKSGDKAVHFKCRLCEKQKPLEDMRTVTRFSPVLVVCKDCAVMLR